MAVNPREDGRTSARLGRGPLAPWLRLAHRYAWEQPCGRGHLRRIRDCMLLFQVRGTSWLWWEPSSGSHALPPGSVAFVPPGILHALGETPGHHYALHFDLIAQPGLVPMAMLDYTGRWIDRRPADGAVPRVELRIDGQEPLTVPVVARPRDPEAWARRCEHLVALAGAGAQRTTAASLATAAELTALMSDLATCAPTSDTGADPIAGLLVRIEREGPSRRWSLRELMRETGLGRTAFWVAFRAATGRSPRDYLEARRIRSAQHLLLGTDRPIAAVAAAVGFEDPYHFSRVFRRVVGKAPRMYRAERGLPPGG